MRDGLRQLQAGQPVTPPPGSIDEFNDRELPQGAGISFEEAAAHANETLVELISLWKAVGDRPLTWYIANTTGEAVIRNSYFHPRNHIAEHFIERGDRRRGHAIVEETTAALQNAEAPPHMLGPALLNLASVRLEEGRRDDALRLLQEAIPMRADLAGLALRAPDFARLRDDPRFQALVRT
jgi:hypothetical protein